MLFGGMHALKDVEQHEIFAENSANVLVFIIRSWLHETTVSCCSSIVPPFNLASVMIPAHDNRPNFYTQF